MPWVGDETDHLSGEPVGDNVEFVFVGRESPYTEVPTSFEALISHKCMTSGLSLFLRWEIPCFIVGMYIARIPNRNSPPALLLREGYQGGKVKTRTQANLSKLPPEALMALRQVLRGETLVNPPRDAFEAVTSLHHGHVQAVLSAMRRLSFAPLIASRASRQRNLVVAMVAARLLEPHSKLGTTRWWSVTTLPTLLEVSDADEDELYDAMDWLLKRQPFIEKKLAACHLHNDGTALSDLSSSYFEGVTCPLAALGHNRDGQKGKIQVNYDLLTDTRGVPLAVSVFQGKASRDPVAPAKRSTAARRMVHAKTLDDGSQVNSFHTLLKLMSGIVRNVCRVPGAPPPAPPPLTSSRHPVRNNNAPRH